MVQLLQGDGSLAVYAGPQQLLWCKQDAQQAQEPSLQALLPTAMWEAHRSISIHHEGKDTSKGGEDTHAFEHLEWQ